MAGVLRRARTKTQELHRKVAALSTKHFLMACLKQGVSPLGILDLNWKHLNKERGDYSKHSMNAYVPEQRRLQTLLLSSRENLQEQLAKITNQFTFPVVLKPDWGHNSHGVQIAHNTQELKRHLKRIKILSHPYICQEFCDHEQEYEIFYIRGKKQPKYMSIARVDQSNNDFRHGIPHGATYHNITKTLSLDQQHSLASHVLSMGEFNYGRTTVKANSKEQLLNGEFKVIEFNILYPLPIHVLDITQEHAERKKEMATIHRILVERIKELRAVSTNNENFTKFLYLFKSRMLISKITKVGTITWD